MEVAYKKIPFSKLQNMYMENDYLPIRKIWKKILLVEVKKGFIAELHTLQFVLDGEDIRNDVRTAVIKYSKIPLYN